MVASYSTDQVSQGKTRYETNGEGNKKSCISCHAAGGNPKAPPHELGSVMQSSDAIVIQWVSTGAAGTRKASIPHAWEFDSPAQSAAVVGYLRTLQTDDIESLTKLIFENEANDGP